MLPKQTWGELWAGKKGRTAIHCGRTYYVVRRMEVYNLRIRHAARRAAAFRQDMAFKQDYYALKSHCVPTIASRLALPNPHSRHLHRDLGVFKIITL